MRFVIILSVILFLVAPIQAAESIITEGINNTITTDTIPVSSSSGSSDGTYPSNYGSGGGGYYRATPTPTITDMPMTVTIEEPLQPEATVTSTPTATAEPTPITLPGFELIFAGLALFGIYAMRARKV